MTKKNILVLTVTILAVAGFYFYLYRDSFKKAGIQINHTFRPRPSALVRGDAGNEDDDINAIHFGLQKDFKLTCVKLLCVNELQTNKFAHPLWILVSSSNSAPTRAFTYGRGIRGMHPDVKGAKAEPLLPNVPYRLIVEAGSLQGEHDFTITEDNHMAQ